MTIKIENIPEGQKIKSINFNIEFDESDGKDIREEDTYEVNISSPVSQNTQQLNPQPIQNTKQEDLPKIDINNDISDRVPKEIPAEMLEESF